MEKRHIMKGDTGNNSPLSCLNNTQNVLMWARPSF